MKPPPSPAGTGFFRCLYHNPLCRFLAGAVIMLMVLTGCYVPENYLAELRIGKTGDYALTFRGDLLYAPLHGEIRAGKLEPAEQARRLKQIEDDLKRDSGFKTVIHKGMARYQVEFERMARLRPRQMASFVRRNAEILSITADPETGTISVRGKGIPASFTQQALAMGLQMKGEFRIVTDAVVRDHNAGEVRLYAGYRVYIWKMDGPLSPPPRFVMERQGSGS